MESKKSQTWSSSKIIIYIISLVFLSILCLYRYDLPPFSQIGIVRSKFIQGITVSLDPRVKQMTGSWNDPKQIHDPEAIEFVYNKLAKQLESNAEVLLIDVGANTGSFSLLPVLSDKIKVIAFEPNLKVADVLHSNIVLNNIAQNVVIIPLGLSKQNGILQLNIPNDKQTGLATFGANILRFDINKSHTYTAVVMTLDQMAPLLVKNDQKINFIKIDTEGWEYYVLLGARETLQQHKPGLFLEFNPTNMQQAGVEPDKLLNFLDSLHYSCNKVGDEDLYCQPL